MTETSKPWGGTDVGDAGPYGAEEWQEMYQYLFGAFMANPNGFILPGSGSGGVDPLAVRPTSPASAAVRIAIGSAVVQGIYYRNDGNPELSFSIAANTSGLPRYDLAILRADYTTQEVRAMILEGTPNAVPTPPSLVQVDGSTWDISLATIYVANGFLTITDDLISRTRYYVAPRIADPPGSIKAFAGATAPTGYLLCHGQTVNIADYPDLYNIIGTTYGGNGVTTFVIPDLRGRTIIGLDNMGGTSANRITNSQADTRGGVMGSETHTLTVAEIPSHQHGYSRVNSTPGSGSIGGGTGHSGQAGITDATGSGGAHNNVQPSIALNYIIST